MAAAAAAGAATSANGLATRVPCRIAEPSTSYSSAKSRSQIRFGYSALKSNRLVSGRGGSLNPRCSHGSENPMPSNEARSSMNLAASALEMLKTSAAERYTKEKSCIFVMGLNVHTAPVELREKFNIPEAQWPQAISELCALNHIEEAAVLSTCNRIEIYVQALSQSRGIKEVTEWMSKTSGVPESELRKRRFLLYDKDATRHLFEVASGLDSLVLGEGQILAQVKQAVKAGQGVAGFGRKIGGLFKNAITVGKRVRSETNIASGSVSVSSAAAELALMKLQEPSFSNARVLVIGAGKMGKLLIKHLIAKGCEKMVVVNRSEERVSAICEEFKNVEIIYKPFSEILSSAAEADVIFTSTASETPLFLKEQVHTLPPVCPKIGRRLFVDISVPRNVDSSVSDLETASVYDVDDLKEVVSANMEDRQQKAQEARVIIEDEVGKFEAWKDSQQAVPTIKKFRAYVERIRAAEVEKCLSKLGDNISKKEKQAIYDLSMGIVNRLLRGPMEHLRCDGRNGCSMNEILENMRALDRMFDLQTETSVLEEKIRSKLEKTRRKRGTKPNLVATSFLYQEIREMSQ